jgi:hypothetical protein
LRREKIGSTFVHGYHAALDSNNSNDLISQLSEIDNDFRGFAFEGAGMALAMLDSLSPIRKDRVRTFLKADGDPHVYMVHVGAGWIIGRLPWLRMAPQRHSAKFDPLLRWLVLDGYGFHEGYFRWKHIFSARQSPKRSPGYGSRAFDQGLGRSIWFVDAASVEHVSATVRAFHPARQADLWSGVGLACAYAGGAPADAVRELVAHAGPHAAAFSQGVAFAAKTRARAGNLVEHTEMACRVACCMSATDAARVTDDSLIELPGDGDLPAYELWRLRIQTAFRDRKSAPD